MAQELGYFGGMAVDHGVVERDWRLSGLRGNMVVL